MKEKQPPTPAKLKWLAARIENLDCYKPSEELLKMLIEKNMPMSCERVYIDGNFQMIEIWIKAPPAQ